MTKNNSPAYKFWNGKNPEDKSAVGNPELIQEDPQSSKTSAKYQVTGDTVSADDLQNDPK